MEPERLYTLADLVEFLDTTPTKLRNWCERSDDTFIPPEFVAGRNNNKGSYIMNLWSFDQLEDVKIAYTEYERQKEERKHRVIEKRELDGPTRRLYQIRYREKRKQRLAEQTRLDLKEFGERAEREKPTPVPKPPKPQPMKLPEYRPLTKEITTDMEDDLEREERALRFLLEKGLA